jgi:hypothetical protein
MNARDEAPGVNDKEARWMAGLKHPEGLVDEKAA